MLHFHSVVLRGKCLDEQSGSIIANISRTNYYVRKRVNSKKLVSTFATLVKAYLPQWDYVRTSCRYFIESIRILSQLKELYKLMKYLGMNNNTIEFE